MREKNAVPYGRGLVAFRKRASGGRHVGAAAAVKKALAVALKRLAPTATLADVSAWQATEHFQYREAQVRTAAHEEFNAIQTKEHGILPGSKRFCPNNTSPTLRIVDASNAFTSADTWQPQS